MELFYPPYPAPVLPRPTADCPSSDLIHHGEMLPVVEPGGVVIARMSREYAHGGSMLLHPVVHLHILNRRGELYLQRRSLDKDLLPGFWDTAVGGHVSYGESVAEALFREAEEELGMYDFHPIPLEAYEFEGIRERERVHVFACVGSFSPRPDGKEVIDGRFWGMEEIEESLGKSVFTPNFEGEFVRIRKKLTALL